MVVLSLSDTDILTNGLLPFIMSGVALDCLTSSSAAATRPSGLRAGRSPFLFQPPCTPVVTTHGALPVPAHTTRHFKLVFTHAETRQPEINLASFPHPPGHLSLQYLHHLLCPGRNGLERSLPHSLPRTGRRHQNLLVFKGMLPAHQDHPHLGGERGAALGIRFTQHNRGDPPTWQNKHLCPKFQGGQRRKRVNCLPFCHSIVSANHH